VLHLDEAIIVLEKPAPLPMHSGGRFHRNTLQHLMNLACEPHVPRAVHRLDANTSGLVVFARTRHFCKLLQRQFIEGSVEKCYLVGVSGHPVADRFTCDAPVSTEAEVTGARRVDDENGQSAVTRFEVLERRHDGTSLLHAVPVTGRTNQIRIHLSHLGHPVIGDPCYQAEGIGSTQTLAPGDPPLRLHAWKLAFRHPLTGGEMRFETGRPAWA
jgi:RluA family pseudouridine synthase